MILDSKDVATDHNRPPEKRPGNRAGKLFIISGRCGRLANRMVLFANFIALAEEQGHRVMNPTFHSYARMFQSTREDIYCQYPVAERRSWMDLAPGVAAAIRGTRLFFRIARPASLLNERYAPFGVRVTTLRQIAGQEITALDGAEVQAKIRKARIVLVNGWNFRAPELVQRHAGKIRNYFRPVSEYEKASRQALERLRQQAEIIIGVHIRRGDYENWKGGQYFFSVSRYAEWMRDLAGQVSGRKVAFLICSNEPREEREFPGLRAELGTGSPVGDLYALAGCDYILGPLSTFSQWASFYGTKPMLHLRGANDRIDLADFKISDLREVP